jgi:hypothetical protein
MRQEATATKTMPPPKTKQHDSRFVAVGLAICTAACISNNHDLVPTAFAFASGNRATKKRFFPNRSLFGRVSSPLFSTEPASNSPLGSPPVAPTVNVVNGASSLEASFDFDASGGTNAVAGELGKADDGLLSAVRKVSNFASFLCVLDCTLLPLVTVALPLLGVLNLGASQLQAIDQLGHSLALWFVLPVGSLTTVINYLSHKKKIISAMAFLGLVMVGLANSHFHVHHWPALGPVSLDWIGSALHKIQGCGTSPWHRIVNVSGCAFLLGSNYWSQQQDGCAAHGIAGSGDCSGHDHSHDHGEGCNH